MNIVNIHVSRVGLYAWVWVYYSHIYTCKIHINFIYRLKYVWMLNINITLLLYRCWWHPIQRHIHYNTLYYDDGYIIGQNVLMPVSGADGRNISSSTLPLSHICIYTLSLDHRESERENILNRRIIICRAKKKIKIKIWWWITFFFSLKIFT